MTDNDTTRLPRGRRWLVHGILALATIVAITAIFGVWANRQVLDADNWADTSSELLADDAVRARLSAFLVDQTYERVDVAAELSAALPSRLDPLAGPASNALRGFAEQRVNRLLERPRVQEAWEAANRVTVQQFIDIAEGDSEAVGINGNAVVLNLREVMTDVVRTLGGSGRLVGKIPDDAARITVMKADQVETLQNGVSTVQGLSVALPALTVALFALAVFLARGRRRRTLIAAGFGLIVAGALVLVGRRLAGDAIVESLASTASAVPAAEAVWSIGTDILRDVAQAAVILGIPLVFAGWVAGPTRAAIALRRAAAPWVRSQPQVAYAVLGAVILLVIAWGPIQATRMVLPVLLFIGLSVLGMEVLRRQIAAEFPEATTGDVRQSIAGSVQRAVHAVSAARHGNGTAAPEPVVIPAAHQSRVDELERLAALHDRGVLTDEEFAAEKALVLTAGGVS